MVCRRLCLALSLAAVVAAALASSAGAARTTLWPGVTYEPSVQFTPNGPVALNVLVGPRPDGTTSTTLAPVLSNERVEGRETLTRMQRRLAGAATTAGVNADLFTLTTGRPSGIFMRDGDLAVAPNALRSSVGVLSDGTLDVRRVSLRGTWDGAGPARALGRLNDRPAVGGTALFTTAYGPSTPAYPGGTAVVLFPFPLTSPDVELPATVAEVRPANAPVSIPEGGAVLLGNGTAGAALATEAVPGEPLTVRLLLQPAWDALVSAVGGGPQIVRDGAPVFRANEKFTTAQLGHRAPRSAVGQRADGRIVLVAVDGRQPGYSVGLTNFELAQALVRLGAVTGMALDGGGSTTMAFDGKLLSRPSGSSERPIASALMFQYAGVFVPQPLPLVSPDGDGVDDAQQLSFRVVRPSTTTVTLTTPDGTVAFTETGSPELGSHEIVFPPAPGGAAAAALAEGRWTLKAQGTDDLGRTTTMTRTFVVNTTLGFVRPERNVLRLPPKGAELKILWKLARQARVGVTIATPGGTVVRAFSRLLYPAGDTSVTWNGLGRDKKPVKGGRYIVRVTAVNALGITEQAKPLIVRRVAA
jgi:phosphodiester glycosidase